MPAGLPGDRRPWEPGTRKRREAEVGAGRALGAGGGGQPLGTPRPGLGRAGEKLPHASLLAPAAASAARGCARPEALAAPPPSARRRRRAHAPAPAHAHLMRSDSQAAPTQRPRARTRCPPRRTSNTLATLTRILLQEVRDGAARVGCSPMRQVHCGDDPGTLHSLSRPLDHTEPPPYRSARWAGRCWRG